MGWTGKPSNLRFDNCLTLNFSPQSFGNRFEVDGRLKGELNVTTIPCDQSANVCRIPVRAPGFALVFMGDNDVVGIGQATQTYPTTAGTRTANTATVEPSVLATSNGHSEKDRLSQGSTSPGSVVGAATKKQGVVGATMMFGLIGLSMIFLR